MPNRIGNAYADRLDDALQVARERAARTGKPVHVFHFAGAYRLAGTKPDETALRLPVITVKP